MWAILLMRVALTTVFKEFATLLIRTRQETLRIQFREPEAYPYDKLLWLCMMQPSMMAYSSH